VEEPRRWLRDARSVCALTGAGISAESGIPTFRGAGGLWRQYRPEDLATPEAFARDPKLVWEWYEWRRGLIAAAQPNAGHIALVQLEQSARSFALVTQNVDGLHRRAGTRNLHEIHGNIWTTRCIGCGTEFCDERLPIPDLPPRCARCGALMRPGVVWFGEGLPREVWHNAQQAAESAEVLLVIGTSAVVYPAASLVPLARAAGARVIEINVDETPLSSSVDATLRGPSGEILPLLTQ
jgi:NAD-dependent deacetylase